MVYEREERRPAYLEAAQLNISTQRGHFVIILAVLILFAQKLPLYLLAYPGICSF